MEGLFIASMKSIPIEIDQTTTRPAEDLVIGGLVRMTTIDFPGCLSAVIFVRGCPWRCIYCQNHDLQSREVPPDETPTTWEEVEHFLDKRKGLLDGVVFSGGEPLMDPAILSAVKAVKAKGFKIGLHTGGLYARRLSDLLQYLDWVGLDVKAPLTKEDLYDKIVGRKNSAKRVEQCLDLILEAGVNLEVRTTAHPDYLNDEALEELASYVAEKGVKSYALQVYRQPPNTEKKYLLAKVGSDYPSQAIISKLKNMFPTFELRRE